MIQFHTLYANNTQEIVDAHQKVMNHFNIPVKYQYGGDHGSWIDSIMLNNKEDVVGFFDSDCVPLSREAIENCINYVIKHDSFIGTAQASNHIPPASHIFAAPCFFIITRDCWERMQKPTFRAGPQWDVAEYVSYAAEHFKEHYRCLYPDCWEREPVEGVWYLSNYGFYGIGTVFENTVYHLFQGRFPNNKKLFIQRCDDIVNGNFSTEGFFNSKDFDYNGNIVR